MPDDIFAAEQEIPPNQKQVLQALVLDVIRFDQEIDTIKQAEKRAREAREAKVQEALKLMTDAGQKSVRFDNGVMASRRTNTYPSVAKEFWGKFKPWLQRHGYWGFATINAQTLKGLLKERIEKGQSIPSYVTVFKEDTLAITNKAAAMVGAGTPTEA